MAAMLPKLGGEHFESAASIILRVPGLFVVDYWWQYDRSRSWPSSLEWTEIGGAILTNIVPLQGVLLMLLRLDLLVELYMHYICASLLVVAHLFSAHYVQVESQGQLSIVQQLQPSLHSDDPGFLKRQVAALLIHVVIASTVAFLLNMQHTAQRMMLAAYALPVVARLSNFPTKDLDVVQNFASAFIILQVIYYVLKYIPAVASSSKYVLTALVHALEQYGWLGVSVAIWNSLFVPVHLFLFWLVHLFANLYCYNYQMQMQHDEWYLVLLKCTSDVCASLISLASTSVAVSYMSFFLLSATKFYLQGYNAFVNDNVVHSGWTEGLTMVLLAMQTGLVELKMPNRAAVMSIILFIVISSLVQSMFEITEPILLALSASHNKSMLKHLRTLLLCTFLFAFPLYMTLMLCSVFQIDFWMLVVISSCIMTSVQVLGLVVIYLLFMYDALRGEPWELLDDVVYGARAVTRVLEFLVAVFVVGAGLRESMQSQWSWINSSVLLIHCYFNVWQRLQSGWKSFLLRREAVRKIESLPIAAERELGEYGDVCAICYADMKTARITRCRHLYHATCLRKWLYVQDKCPMCHSLISHPNEPEEPEEPAEQH